MGWVGCNCSLVRLWSHEDLDSFWASSGAIAGTWPTCGMWHRSCCFILAHAGKHVPRVILRARFLLGLQRGYRWHMTDVRHVTQGLDSFGASHGPIVAIVWGTKWVCLDGHPKNLYDVRKINKKVNNGKWLIYYGCSHAWSYSRFMVNLYLWHMMTYWV